MRRLATALLLSLSLAHPPATRADSPAAPALDSLALAGLIAHGSVEDHKNVEHILGNALKRDRTNRTALALFGRLAIIEEKFALGRTYFQRLLKLDPANREAHREIGRLWEREWGRYREPRAMQRAIDEFEQALPETGAPADSADWVALTHFAALQCERGAAERARAVLGARLDDTAPAWALLLHASALHALGSLGEAEREFERGIRKLGPIERNGFTDVRPVATGADRDAFGQLSLEDRPAWLRIFWKSHDPTPTTSANEFQLEFYHRVTLAFVFFRPSGQKWWDARGDTYVRFGAPDVVDLVEQERQLSNGDIITVAVPDEIVWRYPRFAMDIRMSETTLSGTYTFPFTTRVNEIRPYLNRGTRDRPIFRSPTTGGIGWDPALEHERMITTARERRGAALLDRGAFLVPIDFRRRIVAFHSTHAAFAAQGLGDVRHRIALGVSPASLQQAARDRQAARARGALADTVVGAMVVDSTVAASDTAQALTATAVLFDPAWREVARTVSRGPFMQVETVEGPLLVAALELTAPPGHYYLATAMEDSATIGARREGALAPEYPPTLCLSDIQMVADDSALVRGPRVTLPMPVQTLGGDQPLVLAFEAYNLARDITGTARARVGATIREMPDPADLRTGLKARPGGLFGRPRKAGVITTEFHDVIKSSTLARSFAIDVSALDAGDYEVEVTVHDEGTGLETSSRATFARKADLVHRP